MGIQLGVVNYEYVYYNDVPYNSTGPKPSTGLIPTKSQTAAQCYLYCNDLSEQPRILSNLNTTRFKNHTTRVLFHQCIPFGDVTSQWSYTYSQIKGTL